MRVHCGVPHPKIPTTTFSPSATSSSCLQIHKLNIYYDFQHQGLRGVGSGTSFAVAHPVGGEDYCSSPIGQDPSSGQSEQPWTYLASSGLHYVTQLGNSSVLSHNLFGCSAMGAVCLAVSACRLAGAFPGLGLVALASSRSSSKFLLCLAPCVVSTCAGATLGQIDPLYIIASCYILYTSGSG